MNIIAIEPITEPEQIELNKLKAARKRRTLSESEKYKLLFLEVKQLWKCECEK